MSGTDSQAFRASSSKIITIPTRHDPKSGLRVVRWCDIQQYFENAKGILNGNDAVLFLTNDDLEDLIPRRIAHHPGMVLEVLFAEDTQNRFSAIQSSDSVLVTRDVSNLRITEVDEASQALVVHARGQSPDTSISLPTSSHLHDTHTHRPVALYQESSVLNANQYVSDYSPGQQPEPNRIALEDQLKELRQQVEQIKRQLEDILQQTQCTQQQVDGIPQKIEFFDQQTQQNMQRLKQQINMIEAIQSECLPSDQIRDILQRRQDMIGRYSIIQYHIQELLRSFSEKPRFSRFFIVLPMDTGMDDEQKDSSRLFRLHLLCECDFHTMNKDGKSACEIHMTNHPGYDLKRPTEFFNKYGSYVLTMMYLIKHGTITSGFVVPPLAHSKLVSRIEATQGQIGITRNNIIQLVDDTIIYLEDVAHSTDSDMDTTLHWSQAPANLEELKSHLDVNEGEHFPGSLYQLITQEQHYSWVCSEHRSESAIQRLKDTVNAIDGTYTEESSKIDIKVTSDAALKQLYDVILQISKLQWIVDRSFLAVDCGRLSSTISLSQEDQYVAVTITRLNELTSDDADFIHRCSITQLTIKHTPQDTDEEQLIGILQKSPKLKELCIGCLGERSLAMIKLVISAREKTLQNRGNSALCTFNLMDEGLKPFDLFGISDEFDHVTSKVSFTRDSGTFEMDTCISLRDKEVVTEGSLMSNFFRQYGWSISSLDAPWTFTDHLAAILDDVTQIHDSSLTHLVLSPFSLTADGLDAMDRIIKRSRSLAYFWLYISNLKINGSQESAQTSLARYGEKLNKLSLYGGSITSWLPRLAHAFPTRSCFPSMSDIIICNNFDKREFPHDCIQWLAAMVSPQPQPSGSSMAQDSCTGTPQQAAKTIMRTQLKAFSFYGVILHPQGWETLIKAIDFSTLESLHLDRTNFSLGQLDLLLGCIAGTVMKPVSLTSLSLKETDLFDNADKDGLRARIRKVVPSVVVHG
ncbi:hypothetical protein BGX34_009557 [Mortierella sp. NVP85]|nr:hypothetical protein BGX34_009557 [Mortierella sp. NVP85]